MKKTVIYSLWLLAPFALWAQASSSENPGTEKSEASVDETQASDGSTQPSGGEVIEIPDASIEGVSRNDSEPSIPTDFQSLPEETEIVLELPGQGASQPSEAILATEETISVDFPDEDVRTILRNIADLFELNLVIPDTLQGRTSLKLRNITWQQAFQVVLEPLGFTYVEDRNIIMIKNIEELTTEPVDTRVFVVNYARAQDLRGSIEPLIDAAAGGRVQVDVRSNALVITERPSRMGKIQEIIERLDRATDQVMIETKFVEVTKNDVKDIGVNWASLQGYELSAGPFEREWSRERSFNDNSTTTDGATSSTSGETSSGSTSSEVFNSEQSIGTSFDSLNTLTSTASTGRFDTAVFSAEQFNLVLSALQTANDVELVANPTVVTLDNSLATIDIAEFFPNPQFTFNAETGQRQLNGVDLDEDGIKVGITLEVTPQVNSAGFINLNVKPTVSRSDRSVTIEGSEFPIIDKRTTQTNVTIKDGFTLAIGGLVENSSTARTTKVPVLGDLPGVGRFFKSDSDVAAQRNLIIFITAQTLNPDGTTYRDVIDPRVLNDMGILPSEVPGYKVPEEERLLIEKLEDIRTEAEYSKDIGEMQKLIEEYENQRMKKEGEEEQ